MIICIDGNYLANRAYHALGNLTHNDIPTAVPFGLFNELGYLMERYQCDRFAWFFDQARSLRCSLHPGYKANRQADPETDPEKAAQRQAIREAVRLMATDYLPAVGMRTVVHKAGYEADDLIAAFVAAHPGEDRLVVVSADKDLYQLLDQPNVTIWNPSSKKEWDAAAFQHEYGLPVALWPDVKAVMGDDGDNVPGVPGVGLVGATKWVLGTLKPTTKQAQAILAADDLVVRNYDLVRLPWPGTPAAPWREPEVTVEAWEALRKRLGFQEATVPIPKLMEPVSYECQRQPVRT